MSSSPHSSSRRTVLKGAAWAAPVVVVAAAAPAVAASGPARVTTVVSPTSDNGSTLPVVITYTNINTGTTGLTTAAVRFAVGANFLGVRAGTVLANAPTNVSAGWTFNGPATGTTTNRVFTFTRQAPGIVGASSATGTATTELSFTVGVTETVLVGSFGTITVSTVPDSNTGAIVDNGSGAAWT